jgi:hypothetical protein
MVTAWQSISCSTFSEFLYLDFYTLISFQLPFVLHSYLMVLPDTDQGGYSVTRKIFGTERFSRQTTVHAFLTYILNYALNNQFWKKRPRSTSRSWSTVYRTLQYTDWGDTGGQSRLYPWRIHSLYDCVVQKLATKRPAAARRGSLQNVFQEVHKTWAVLN